MIESDFKILIDRLTTLNEESEWVEFKQNNSDKREIGEYISALSNSGVIHKQERAFMLWGVKDDTKEVVGTNFVPSQIRQGNQALDMWLSQKLRPRPHFEFYCGNYKNKPVVILSIRPVKEEPVKFDGVAYVRVGSHKTRLDDQPGKQREFWSQTIIGESGSWDERIEERATSIELDDKKIESFLQMLIEIGRRVPPKNEKASETLEKLHLIVNGKPTRAALLLFGKEPKHFYSSAYIKAGRFKTATAIEDDKEFDGTLFDQIEESMRWFRERMSRKFIIGKSKMSGTDMLSGAQREEQWQYPLATLREAIVNAICHRDYMVGAATTIRLFDSRLEIVNPGTLPSDLVCWS